jgi:hypothetical protein
MMRNRSWVFLSNRNSMGAYCSAIFVRSFFSVGFNFSE